MRLQLYQLRIILEFTAIFNEEEGESTRSRHSSAFKNVDVDNLKKILPRTV